MDCGGTFTISCSQPFPPQHFITYFEQEKMVSKNITESVHSPAESDKSVEAQLQADHHSDLYLSLEEALKNPSCVSDTWIENIADLKNNPRTLPYAPYNDNAFHYVDHKQKPLCMAFPAVIDLNGKFTKIGPYFNLMGDHTVKASFHFFQKNSHVKHVIYHQDVNMTLLAKTKAIFQLSPLTVLSAHDLPNDAIDCSTMAMNVLHTLYATVDEMKNAGSSPFFIILMSFTDKLHSLRSNKTSFLYPLSSN